MINIDQYSVAAIPIEMLFNGTNLGVGTAFVWSHDARFFLVTNWHNVSGKDPNTGKHLSKTAAEPNTLRVWFNQKGRLGNKIDKLVPVRNSSGMPVWLVHPIHGNKVDAVAISIPGDVDIDMYPINLMENANLRLQVGMDVFVLGFPFAAAAGGFPIWKRGSFASEPELSPATQIHLLVDTASRPGMSGSPVIRRSWGTHMMADGGVTMGTGSATKFVGIYSGRTASNGPLDAQLGFVWPASLVTEIIAGGQVDQ